MYPPLRLNQDANLSTRSWAVESDIFIDYPRERPARIISSHIKTTHGRLCSHNVDISLWDDVHNVCLP